MGLFGCLTTLREQAPRTPGFATAFSYVEELLRDGSAVHQRLRALKAGETIKTELAGGLYVVEQAYETKARPDGFFEAHKKYIDVQVVLEGTEVMEMGDATRMRIRDAYNPDRDLVVYEDSPDACVLKMAPGLGAIFFPVDVHMPSLRAGAQPVLVRKAVVKVPVS